MHPSKPFKLNTCLDTSICQDLLNSYIYIYIYVQHNPFLTFLDLSLNRSIFSPPKHYFLSQNLQPMWFLNSPCFKSLGMLSFLFILHAFHAFRSRFWGFWKILEFFKIVEFLLKFWNGFLFKWSLNLMHCIAWAL